MKLRTYLITLTLLLLSAIALQARIITGIVTEAATGEPLIGVTILLKGTPNGALTDFDGRFTLTVPDGRQVLSVSYIGFKTMEVVVEPSVNVLNIALEEDYQQLDEVVIRGYAVQKKMTLAASVSTISNINIESNKKRKGSTWKRSGMPENSIRLEVGDRAEDFLPLQAAQMAVQVDGFRVRVLMDCFFFNDKKDGLEGTFKLRLPTGATPYYFAFGETEYLDDEDFDEDAYDELIRNENKIIKPYGKLIPYAEYNPEEFDLSPEGVEKMDSREWDDVKEARIVSKQKAARAYESTVSARIDPALMEWAGADMFTCRVYPLTRGQLHRVVIGYDLNMVEALDFREFILTLPKEAKELRMDADLYTSATMMPQITPAVESKVNNNRMFFTLQNPKKKEYSIRYNNVISMMLFGDDESNNTYFASNFRINLPEIKQDNLPSDAVFIFDISLSSQPDKFNVWLKLVEEILSKNKDVIKRFSVLCFNIDTFWWNRYYLRNNYYNFNSFLEFANTLALEGATDLSSALKEASAPAWLKKNAPKHIFLMSDADFNWGETNMFALKSLIKDGDRVHTYKTGLSGTNTAVLDYLSKETGGFSFTVTGEEEAELTAKSFRYLPWNIEEIRVNGVEDFLISGEPSQLYNGQKLIFSGRNKPEGEIYVRVNNGAEVKELKLNPAETINSTLAKRVYGQIALAQLEGYSFQTEEATESYATYFRIPNATMSFLMLESERDYDRFGIDDYDARYYVDENKVTDIVKQIVESGQKVPLGDGKTDFLAWLKRMENDEDLEFEPDNFFNNYLANLPDEIFTIKLKPYDYKIRFTEQQSEEEREMIANENLLYDDVTALANKRKNRPDALKLLSSVIERNPGDFVALRDLAIKAIDWGLGEQAYYMMRRIMANRQYEAVAYLTAADALAKSGNTDMALIYYYICLNTDWDDDYGSFSEIAALKAIRYMDELLKSQSVDINSKAKKKEQPKIELSNTTRNFITHFRKQVEEHLMDEDLLIGQADIVIIINWNTNNTDLDLHVMEPTGEECYYGHRNTEIGGRLTIDVTDGYGPEMYVLKNAVNGNYKASINYYWDDDTKTSSKTKVYVDFYQNWGRDDEKHIRKTIVLENSKDREDILQFSVKKIIEQ